MGRHRIRIPVRSFVVVGLAVIMVAAGNAATGTAGVPRSPRWPAHPDWKRYVEAPVTSDVRPVRVVSTSGSVTGAKSITAPAGIGTATLTMKAGKTSPTVVFDYGKDVGGIPYFTVGSETGAPVLHASYSEGRQYVGPKGDQTPSSSSAGDLSRTDDLTISSSGRITTGLIQGGERYERITLSSPGTVTLSAIGIHFTAVRATAKDFHGWFDSSSAELDRIWYDGAYTTQLDELPAGTLPKPWRITAGALEAEGGTTGVLSQGTTWTDYSMSFATRVVNDDSDWIVRGSSSSGYLFILHDAAEDDGGPDTLQEVAFGPSEFSVIGRIALPHSFDARRWHHVTTLTSGTHITTSIDGKDVGSFDTDSLPSGASVYRSGSVGFAALGSTAMFRDLDVTDASGGTLYANDLSRSSSLSAFAGPDIATPDPLPVIMDGAKRDRVVWSGDLGVEVPNVFYTTDTDSFVRGSLRLLASYQDAEGESGSNVPPTIPLGSFPENGYNYSTSYSMDEVDNIATYYLCTGDLSFVRSEWPMITRELAYNASMVDSRDLLVTDASDGMDWDYYDGGKTGEVTAYNDIYYRTLTDAETLAGALGLDNQAVTYQRDASDLRSAINRYLFDPTSGLYAASNLQPSAVAQDGNALAVLFGVAPKAEDASILADLTEALPETPYGPLPFSSNAGYRAAVSPFVTNEEVEALFASGVTDEATKMVRTLWGYMDGPGRDATGTDWEVVGAHGSPGFGAGTSLAHGWSSGATAALSSEVLGVQPSTAGFRTWSVKPHPGSLSWAEGDVSTPHGPLGVRWAQVQASGRFAIQVQAPGRTRGTITLPQSPRGAVVTIHTTGPGKTGQSTRVIHGGPGAPNVSVAGGTTVNVEVVPR